MMVVLFSTLHCLLWTNLRVKTRLVYVFHSSDFRTLFGDITLLPFIVVSQFIVADSNHADADQGF